MGFFSKLSVLSVQPVHISTLLLMDKQIVERASLTLVSDAKDGVKTPGMPYAVEMTPTKPDVELEGGALRPGGAPDLYSKKYVGMLFNYASVGVVYGLFPSLVYAFFKRWLNMESYQVSAARVLVTMPWSFKTFIGILTDSFPIMGYRRRPYMVIGWLMTLIFLGIMVFIPVPNSFYIADQWKLDAKDRIINNIEAPNEGGVYLVLMLMACVGYVTADVAADGMVVELAQREPEDVRGNTQATIYLVRTIFSMITQALCAFGFNGKEVGGEFDFFIPINYLILIAFIMILPTIPASIFYIEEQIAPREFFRDRCAAMWRISQQRAVYQVVIFNFFNSFLWSFTAPSYYSVQSEWAQVTVMTENIFGIIGNLVFAFSIWITKKYFLGHNWRYMTLITSLIVIAIDMTVSFITISDTLRNQWFWVGTPLLETLPEGIRFIIGALVTVEVAEEGYEGVTYGFLTTVSNLANPLATSLFKQLAAEFKDAQDGPIAADTMDARWSVTYTFIIMYVAKLLSNAVLPLLPPQKKECHELRKRGKPSALIGGICILVVSWALIWSVTTNLMSVFPQTACYKIAGGQGCA